MLDFRIETFLTVCQTMNYTEAARQLHITQPAVSQHIRALEQQYGADFFHYQGKRLSLTEAGQLFYRTALAMRHDAAHLKDQIQSLSSSPVLNFGATLTIGEYIMPEPLLHLIQTRPDIRLRMMVENTDELLTDINQKSAELDPAFSAIGAVGQSVSDLNEASRQLVNHVAEKRAKRNKWTTKLGEAALAGLVSRLTKRKN